MISKYLCKLYTNCKLLKQTSKFNSDELSLFFENYFKLIFAELNINSEEEALTILLAKTNIQQQNLLNKCNFIKLFYFVNSFNEYNCNTSDLDDLMRYKYHASSLTNKGIESNFVLDLIKKTINTHPQLQSFFKIENHKSYFYLSHDIDSVYGSLKQDGLWAIKKGRLDIILKLIFNTIALNPNWLNFDLIMKTESEYDFKSTFYWLVNKGRIDNRQKNADYSISSKKIKLEINKIIANGFEIGLHKSISNESFKSEMAKMPIEINSNRYHYLKFNLPMGYNAVEEAGLKSDSSLGFAEQFGFRNGYGYPFHPFNVYTKESYRFLEIPLTIMDGTFQRYLKIPVEKTAETIINFIEKNNENTLLSLLWHNTFFADYKHKGYLNEYKKILSYLYESKFQNINQNEIINQFSWQAK